MKQTNYYPPRVVVKYVLLKIHFPLFLPTTQLVIVHPQANIFLRSSSSVVNSFVVFVTGRWLGFSCVIIALIVASLVVIVVEFFVAVVVVSSIAVATQLWSLSLLVIASSPTPTFFRAFRLFIYFEYCLKNFFILNTS